MATVTATKTHPNHGHQQHPPSSWMKDNRLLKHHQQVLHAISPSSSVHVDDNNKISNAVIQHESQIFGIYYKYLFAHHVVSIEPIDGYTRKSIGPAFFTTASSNHHTTKCSAVKTSGDDQDWNRDENEHDEIQYDPALFRFYAIVLSSSSFSQANGSQDEILLSPPSDHHHHRPTSDRHTTKSIIPSSPAGSSTSTSISRSAESPKTPKEAHLYHQGTTDRRRILSTTLTPMKGNDSSTIMVHPTQQQQSQPLLYFGFQQIPFKTKDNKDSQTIITRKKNLWNPIQFYCVDHFQLSSIQVDEENLEEKEEEEDEKEKEDTQEKSLYPKQKDLNQLQKTKNRNMKLFTKKQQPCCILFQFPSCTFRIFISPFHSSQSSLSGNNILMSPMILKRNQKDYLYQIMNWLQYFVHSTTTSISILRSTTYTNPMISYFSSYLQQVYKEFMTTSSLRMLIETSSSSSGPCSEEAGQRIMIQQNQEEVQHEIVPINNNNNNNNSSLDTPESKHSSNPRQEQGHERQQMEAEVTTTMNKSHNETTIHSSSTARIIKRKRNDENNNVDHDDIRKRCHGNEVLVQEGKQDDTSIRQLSLQDSWSMLNDSLFSTIPNHPSDSSSSSSSSLLVPNHLFHDIPYQLSLELSSTLYSDEDVIRKSIKDCEKNMETILQELFPTPKHRIMFSKNPLYRSSFTPTTTTTTTTTSNTPRVSSNIEQEKEGDDTRNKHSSSTSSLEEKLQTYLQEYDKLLKERQLSYLHPKRL